MEGLHTMGVRPGSPRGIVYDTGISSPVSCNLRHDTFHHGVGRPEPW